MKAYYAEHNYLAHEAIVFSENIRNAKREFVQSLRGAEFAIQYNRLRVKRSPENDYLAPHLEAYCKRCKVVPIELLPEFKNEVSGLVRL